MINLLLELINKKICRIVKYNTPSCASTTVLQAPVVQLRHIKSNQIIKLPIKVRSKRFIALGFRSKFST